MGALLKFVALAALAALVGMAVRAAWRRVFGPGESGRLGGATGAREPRGRAPRALAAERCPACRTWVVADHPPCGRADCPRARA